MLVAGVGRRPHRCRGAPSSGSSADFPPPPERVMAILLGRVRPASVQAAHVGSRRRGEGRRRRGDRSLDMDDNGLYRTLLGTRPWSAASEKFLSKAVSANPPCPCKQIGDAHRRSRRRVLAQKGRDAWRPRDSTFFLVPADGWRLAVIEVLLSNVGVPRTACIGTARVHCTARGVTEKGRQPAMHRRQHKRRVGCTCCTYSMNASAVAGTANRRTEDGQAVCRAG